MSAGEGVVTVGEARARYFAEAGFPADGGYAAKFVELARLGPIPLGFPNSNARRRAVVLHDLHHVVTGFRTDWRGEAEISAWEIASGCDAFAFAWYINLLGMVMGWVVDAGATWRAFVRGRHSRNLYGAGFSESLLREPVAELRERLALDRPQPEPSNADRAAYTVWCGLALVDAGVTLALLAAPFVWLARALV
jgi:hypothetical protein